MSDAIKIAELEDERDEACEDARKFSMRMMAALEERNALRAAIREHRDAIRRPGVNGDAHDRKLWETLPDDR